MKNTSRLLKIANNQISKRLDQLALPYGLTGTQMTILDYLYNHESEMVLQKDLEEEFNIQRSTTTVLLQRMEKKDLIERFPISPGARKKGLSLTKEGSRLALIVHTYVDDMQKGLEENFTAQEIAVFEKILAYYAKGGIR